MKTNESLLSIDTASNVRRFRSSRMIYHALVILYSCYFFSNAFAQTPFTNNSSKVCSGVSGSFTNIGYVGAPTGTTSLTIRISGGTGDADLYVGTPGFYPTKSNYLRRSINSGNSDSITITNPDTTQAYGFALNGYSAYSNTTLTVTYTVTNQFVAQPSLTPNGGSSFGKPMVVTAYTGVSGSTMRYTINGADPTINSSSLLDKGTIPLNTSGTFTIRIRNFLNGVQSAVTSATYTVTIPPIIRHTGPSNDLEISYATVPSYSTIYYTIEIPTPSSYSDSATANYGLEFYLASYSNTIKAYLQRGSKPSISNSIMTFSPTFVGTILPGDSTLNYRKVFLGMTPGNYILALENNSNSPQIYRLISSYQSVTLMRGGNNVSSIPSGPTWLVIHGRTDTPFKSDSHVSFDYIRSQMEVATDSAAYTVDWRGGADSNYPKSFGLQGTRFFNALSSKVRDILSVRSNGGIVGSSISLIGHSWGALASQKIGQTYGKVDRIIALDPAQGGLDVSLGDYTKNDGFNFKSVANYSFALTATGGNIFGSEIRANTAAISTNLKLIWDFGNFPDDAVNDIFALHSGPVNGWSYITSNRTTPGASDTLWKIAVLRQTISATYIKLTSHDLVLKGKIITTNGQTRYKEHREFTYAP